MRHEARRAATTLGLLTMGLALGLGGCAATHQARSVQPSGFLGTYSELYEGKAGEALLLYVDPSAPWRSYDKVLIEPVTIWTNNVRSAWLTGAPKDQQQMVVDYAEASLRATLDKDVTIVDSPGPGTLRLRVAITEAEGSPVPTDVRSTSVPQKRTRSRIKRLATGTAALVGRACVEVEAQDSLTGHRIAAGVDRRVGQKWAGKRVLSTWGDVEKAFDTWAEQLRARFAQLRAS